MSRRFFSSDFHFNSTCLVEEGVRPFRSVERMNEVIIQNVNQRCKEDDILIHLGDFIQYGNDRRWTGMKTKPFEFIRKIDPMFVNVQGNHDKNNGMKSVCISMRTHLGRKYSVSLSHYPSNNPLAKGTFRKGDVHLCGHVHGAWKYFIDFDNKVLNINVGVDVWRFNPVSEDELITYIDSIMRSNASLKRV
jgi:calcineurin-like phosphoesterase family protein